MNGETAQRLIIKNFRRRTRVKKQTLKLTHGTPITWVTQRQRDPQNCTALINGWSSFNIGETIGPISTLLEMGMLPNQPFETYSPKKLMIFSSYCG